MLRGRVLRLHCWVACHLHGRALQGWGLRQFQPICTFQRSCFGPHPPRRPLLPLCRSNAHGGERVHCLAVGPDGLLYSGGSDKVLLPGLLGWFTRHCRCCPQRAGRLCQLFHTMPGSLAVMQAFASSSAAVPSASTQPQLLRGA